MRRDMNKVLIERPRAGGRGKQRKKFEKVSRSKRRFRDYDEDYNIDIDDAPQKVSMKKPHKVNGNSKIFTDLLGPLVRFLRSKDGQHWDDVWSEICQVMKGTGLQASHIKDHIKLYVGGIPHAGIKHYVGKYGTDAWNHDSSDPVYVDENGILRKNPEWRKYSYRRREPKKYYYYRESANIEYHKINGAWFRFEYNKVTSERFYKSISDYVYKRSEISYDIYDKRTVSKKEIKRLDLNNRFEYTPPSIRVGEYSDKV